MVYDEASAHLEALRRLLADLEPAALSPEDSRRLLQLGCCIEALGASLKMRVAKVAVLGVPYGEEGHRSQAGWLAEATRSSLSQATELLVCGQALESLPVLAEAISQGELSSLETRSLVCAAKDNPGAQEELLSCARALPVSQMLRVSKETARAGREKDPAQRQALLSRRYCRSWSAVDGMLRLSAALLPEDGLAVVSAIRSAGAHFSDEARRAGLGQEDPSAYEADALVALVRDDRRIATFFGPEGGRSRRPEMVLHVNLEALRRGQREDGEICEVPGVGPVSLEVAEGLIGESLLNLVISDGVSVASVTHVGRCVPAPVQSGLEARDRHCVVPGCQVTVSLEIDHWQIPFAKGGPSALWNLARICRLHHRMKTYDGWELSGGPGQWEWNPPKDLAPPGDGPPAEQVWHPPD